MACREKRLQKLHFACSASARSNVNDSAGCQNSTARHDGRCGTGRREIRSEKRVAPAASASFPQRSALSSTSLAACSRSTARIATALRLLRSLWDSGIIVKPDGYIVTDHHVIDGAEAIRLRRLTIGSSTLKSSAGVRRSDLAVLKISADKLPVLRSPTGQGAVGDVFSRRQPLGIGQTVPAGIVAPRAAQPA